MSTLPNSIQLPHSMSTFTHSIQLPVASLTLRPDQWILIEEALMQQSQILYDISGRNYDRGDYETAVNVWDKCQELESLAHKVGSVIESLQANATATTDKENQ